MENQQYINMFIKKESNDDKKDQKDSKKSKLLKNYDDENEQCWAGSKKVQCMFVKQMYSWFTVNLNEFGTLSNKINYMDLVRLLNTIEAKQLY